MILTIVSRTDGRGIVCSAGQKYIDFISCSHLGLEQHPALAQAIKRSVDKFGVQYAAARTRAKCDIFDELEAKLNTIFLDSHTVIFNSVGAAHLAALPIMGSGELPGYSISPKGVQWIVDKTTHASVQILRGILEQFALPCHYWGDHPISVSPVWQLVLQGGTIGKPTYADYHRLS